jgi:Flp pilus assembly protein TadG
VTTLAARLRRAGRNDRGALTLSYVVILPVIFLFLMSLIQASFWFLARNAALTAARQGVETARALGSSDATGQAAAMSFARKVGSGYLLDPNARVQTLGRATVTVTVWGHVPSFIPGLPLGVSETVQAPLEVFQS